MSRSAKILFDHRKPARHRPPDRLNVTKSAVPIFKVWFESVRNVGGFGLALHHSRPQRGQVGGALRFPQPPTAHGDFVRYLLITTKETCR